VDVTCHNPRGISAVRGVYNQSTLPASPSQEFPAPPEADNLATTNVEDLDHASDSSSRKRSYQDVVTHWKQGVPYRADQYRWTGI
jgi:hypothetical protein